MKNNNEPSIPNYGKFHHNSPDPFNSLGKRQKAQVESIPGVSPKEPRRYRVKLGDEIVATKLTCDEASAFIKAGVAR